MHTYWKFLRNSNPLLKANLFWLRSNAIKSVNITFRCILIFKELLAVWHYGLLRDSNKKKLHYLLTRENTCARDLCIFFTCARWNRKVEIECCCCASLETKFDKVSVFMKAGNNEALAGQTLRLADGVNTGHLQLRVSGRCILYAVLVHIMAASLLRLS